MKRIRVFLLAVSLIFSLNACSKNLQPAIPSEQVDATTESTSDIRSEQTGVSVEKDEETEKPSAEEKVIAYLMEQVPEIGRFNNQVEEYNQTNNTAGKPILRIDSVPDDGGTTQYEKEFYAIYIGESTDSHTNRWATFLVKKDLKEILVDDPATGLYITLQQWREDQIQ